MPENEVVLLGIGEIVGVPAKALPRPGFTLHPVSREKDIAGLRTGGNPDARFPMPNASTLTRPSCVDSSRGLQ
ncbi:MAG: hypothetical protein AB2827_20015 [Candidatus Thiodiazotropha sp.]